MVLHSHCTTRRADGLRAVSTRAGVVTFQSQAMTEKRAAAFAACLNANAKYAQAAVRETAKGSGRFTVCFLPASADAQETLFAKFQQEQTDRAIAEMDGYDISLLPSGVANVTTLPDKNGKRETYLVSADLTECSCPHFQYRLKAAGAFCKHICAVAAYREHEQKVAQREEAGCECCGELVEASTLAKVGGFLVCPECLPFLMPTFAGAANANQTPRSRAEKIALDFD